MKSCCPQWLKYLLLHLRASPILTVKHRLPFRDISFALWWSLRLLMGYFALLVIRSSLCSPIPVCRDCCYAPTPLSFQCPPSPCPDSPCPRDGMLVFWRFDSLWLCAQLLQRKLVFSGSNTETQDAIQADKNGCEWCPPTPPLLSPSCKGVGR